jgi:hypothetical protein
MRINRTLQDTLTNWTLLNPVLGNGDISIVTDAATDNAKVKIGNGSDDWTTLDFFMPQSKILYSSAATSSHTGNTTPTVIRTVVIPANTLTTNGDSLTIIPFATCTNNANAKAFSVEFGSTTISNVSFVSLGGVRKYIELYRRSATTGLYSTTTFANGFGSAGNALVPSIDWSIDNNMTFTVTLGNGGDTIQLETVKIRLDLAP